MPLAWASDGDRRLGHNGKCQAGANVRLNAEETVEVV